MRIGIVSDTHGHLGNTRAAVSALQNQDVEIVLHCGDIGSVAVVALFDAWPTHFVFGNVDHDERRLQEAIEISGQTCHGRFGELNLSAKRIAILHSDDAKRFRETIGSGQYDLVCYGHSHIAEQHRDGETLVLNPGAIYRANPHSVAVIELDSMTASHVML